MCEKVLEMAVEWAKMRVQYDMQIGRYQAIQHKCVNMLRNLEGTRAMTYAALSALSDGDAPLEVAAAKAYASETAQFVAYEGHMVFAGQGFMQEHDMQLYSRRLKQAELNLGDAEFHREALARVMGI